MGINDGLILIGMILIVYGVGLMFIPAAFIASGIFLFIVVFFAAYVRKAGDD